MTCGAKDKGGVKVSGHVEVSGANEVDNVNGGNIVSCVDQPPPCSASRP